MLYANGCSFVWGDELDGCYDDPPTHHPLTFVSHIAKKLGIPYVNEASCGASNHKIFRDTMLWLSSEKSEKCTHVIVLMSAWTRDELPYDILKEQEEMYHVHRHDSIVQYSDERIGRIGYMNKSAKKTLSNYLDFEKRHGYRKYISQQLPYMIAIDQICKSRGIKLIMGSFHERNWYDIIGVIKKQRKGGTIKDWNKLVDRMLKSLPKNSSVGLGVGESFYAFCDKIDAIKPKGHPDEKGHALYADYLLETIGFG